MGGLKSFERRLQSFQQEFAPDVALEDRAGLLLRLLEVLGDDGKL